MSDQPSAGESGHGAEPDADARREYARAYRERNAEHVREYRRRYREEHLEEERARNREYMRQRGLEERRAEERAERRRVSAREYYATHRDEVAEAARRARVRQKAADPERYLAQRRESSKRWRDKNRDRENAKLRAQYEQNGEVIRDKARAFYDANRDRILAQRKAARDADPEAARERQRRYRAGEKRRREAGLPPYRRHRTTPGERAQHQTDADRFFAQLLSPERVRANRNGPPTPTEVIARWNRDSARARAEHFLATDEDSRHRRHDPEVRRLAHELDRGRNARQREAEQAAQDARMDAIAHRINATLRRPRRTLPGNDPAAPHIPGGPTSVGGLSR